MSTLQGEAESHGCFLKNNNMGERDFLLTLCVQFEQSWKQWGKKISTCSTGGHHPVLAGLAGPVVRAKLA